MIKEINGPVDKEGDSPDFRFQRNKDKPTNVNIEQINMQVYKYQPDKDGKGMESMGSKTG